MTGAEEQRLDALAKKVLFATAGKNCARCGHGADDPMHIIGRAKSKALRWDMDNLLPGCRKCHRYFTDHPSDWIRFVDKLLGQGYYEKMRKKANKVSRGLFYEDIALELKEYLRTCKI